MKYITFAVPCFNSSSYMKRCIDSLLFGGSEVEIIIIDDGSTDQTGQIADEYAALYPDIIRTVHKENGGHGSGVNLGLKLAQGIYYKVVDSDDWLDKAAYKELLNRIHSFVSPLCSDPLDIMPDLLICNYIYDHLEIHSQRVMRFDNVFPQNVLCTWNDIGHFSPSQYLVMHALVYKTKILHQCNINLPEHTFYVDNIFAYQPLPLVKTIYYMNIDLYHYYLGREDQSVNENVLIERIDQQILVTNLVSRCVDFNQVKKTYPKLVEYMKRNISIMLAISDIHLLLMQTDEAYQKRKYLWDGIKEYDKALYYHLKYSTLCGWTYLPGKFAGKLTIGGYRIAKKIYKFLGN